MAVAEDGNNIAESWEDIDEEKLFNGHAIECDDVVKPVMYHNGPIVIGHGDDALRTQYLPPEPLVRILKRPSKEERTQLAAFSIDVGGGKHVKSLRQREAEYAEARQRIMGHVEERLHDRFETSETVAASSSINSAEAPVAYTLLRPTERLNNNVVRMPRGPDNTPGFSLPR